MDAPSLPAAIVEASAALPRARVRDRRVRRAVTSYDEDAVTLAAAAAQDVMAGAARASAVVVASVSAPLVEGGIAATLVEVLGLTDVLVAEHGGTVAAGGSALAAAVTLVNAGVAPVLYVATDTRRDEAGRALGDGAVAALLDAAGAEDTIAEVTWGDSSATLFRDAWRADGQARVTTADASLLPFGPRPTAAVSAGPTAPLLDGAGALGSAGLLVGALHALASAAAGDEIPAAVSAGGITHTFRFVAAADAPARAAQALRALELGIDGPVPKGPDLDAFDPYTSQPRAWRERGMDLRLEGLRDPATGEVLFPAPPPSSTTAHLEPFRLGRSGRVFTFTRDHVFPFGAPLTMAVVELDGGGRFFGQVVDGQDVEIGQDVDLVLRRLHSGGGMPQYFWKISPRARASADAAAGRS